LEACHHEQHLKEDHHEMMIVDFKKRFWVSLILTIPILILSPMIQSLLFFTIKFNFDLYLLFFLSSVLFFYGGYPFLKGMYREVSQKQLGMMTLIGLAISVAYLYSAAGIFFIKKDMFFWEIATLIDIMLIGHIIEMKSVIGASRSLELLVKMMPSRAFLIKDAKIEEVEIDQLKINDVVLVKPGNQLPVDGIVVDGISYVDEAFLTGESKPVKKEKENKVVAGSINGNGSLKIKTLKLGKDSYLSKVISLVRDAQKTKSRSQKLADRAAKWLTIIAVSVGLITFIGWILAGQNIGFGLERMVSVMVISCPHALGLAIPLVVSISTSICARQGLLIRNREAFENARKITTVVFDKTGTLTKGNFGVRKYQSLLKDYSDEKILKLSATLEQQSEHPIAKGILDEAKKKKIDILPLKNFKAISGEGIEGEVDTKFVQVVSFGYLKKNNISMDKNHSNAAETVVYVLIDHKLAGYISLADEIREESYQIIKKLKMMNIKTVMITGDNDAVAKAVSKELGLDSYYANSQPHQKLEIVKDLQKKNEFVAMTGDGINDAPALAQADIGIAIGSGTDVAAETADIILVKSNPLDILALILFGRATYNKMIQNLLWAIGYNAFAIPLAAGALYSYGILISPAIGAVLMSLSTIIVAFNARLLKADKSLKLIKKHEKGEIL
jgi:Cu2+-exporting ATPase